MLIDTSSIALLPFPLFGRLVSILFSRGSCDILERSGMGAYSCFVYCTDYSSTELVSFEDLTVTGAGSDRVPTTY